MSKKLASLIIRISANGAQAEKELKTLEKKVNDFGKSMKNFGKNMSKYVTVPLTALAAASVKLADTQLQAEAKLLNALKGREDVQKRLMAQASEMQGRSLFGDEAIIEQQAYLAALGLSEQQISDTIEAAMQLSAALGMDLTSATKNLAKTYGGMTGELGESIPALKNLTTEELKAGEAIKFVNENYKGFAETAAKTGAGSLVQLKNKLGDLAEKLGMILLPILNDLVAIVGKVADYLSSLPEGVQKFIVGAGALVAAVGPMLTIGGSLILNFDKLVAIIPRLGQALTLLATHPIAVAVTALAALGTHLFMARKRHEEFMRQLNEQSKAEWDQKELEERTKAYQDTYQEYSRPIYSDNDLRSKINNIAAAHKSLKSSFRANDNIIDKIEALQLNILYEKYKALTDIITARQKAAEDAAAIESSQIDFTEVINNELDTTVGIIGELQAQIAALEDKKLLATSKEEIGEINLQLAELNKQLDEIKDYDPTKVVTKLDKIATKEVKFGINAPKVPKVPPLEKSFDIEAWKRKFLPMADEMVAMIDSLNSAVSSAFGNLASAMGEGIEAAITGDEFKPMQRLMLIIGDMLKQMGAALVAYATAMEAFKEAFKNPWVALGAGLAAIAAGATITGLAKKGIPKLATGGIAYAPTLAVVGDNAGAANDPEVIAPLSKLRSYMGSTKLELVGDIKWELRGDTLRAVLNRDNVRLKTLG